MKNKKVAFICPTHPPHFDFVKSMISSFLENDLDKQADLWFIFSNKNDADNFGNYEYKLILPDEYFITDNNGIINIKKLWGIKNLAANYEYIISIDSESCFIKKVDVYQLCQEFFQRKILLGNKVLSEGKELTDKIKERCKVFFPGDCQHFLDSDLYLWFNQPCIYKTANLNKFFEVTKCYDNLKSIDWFQFDYYIYMNFLIIYEGFSIIDMELESSYGVCEASSELTNINSDKYKQLKIMMCSFPNLSLFDNPLLFLLIQIDRY